MIEYLMERIADHDSDQMHYYYGFYNDYYELVEGKENLQSLNDLKDYIRFYARRDMPFARL